MASTPSTFCTSIDLASKLSLLYSCNSTLTSMNYMQLTARVINFLMLLQLAAAGYVFEAMVHSYSNPHSQARFLPCDLFCFFGSVCQCDNQFTFCLRNENGSRSTNVDFCSLGDAQQTQFFDNSDNMNFEMLDTLGNSVPNPLFFTGDIWPVSKIMQMQQNVTNTRLMIFMVVFCCALITSHTHVQQVK